MLALPAWAAVTLFGAVALRDILMRTIDHSLLAALSALWVVVAVQTGMDGALMLQHVAMAFAAFLFLAGAFALGWMAGGDVKLGAVVFLWAGPDNALGIAAIVAILGGAVALACIAADGLRRLPVPAAMDRGLVRMSVERGVPYGVALGAGGILSVLASLVR